MRGATRRSWSAVILTSLALPACLAEETPPTQPPGFTATVTRVKDGDSLVVIQNHNQTEIRLQGVDCPELHQAFGEKAREATSQLAQGKTVTIHPIGTDKYQRTLADVILSEGRILNDELVRLGAAWWYRKYSEDQTLAKLEAEARKERRASRIARRLGIAQSTEV